MTFGKFKEIINSLDVDESCNFKLNFPYTELADIEGASVIREVGLDTSGKGEVTNLLIFLDKVPISKKVKPIHIVKEYSKCPQCGHDNRSDSRYCSRCGILFDTGVML